MRQYNAVLDVLAGSPLWQGIGRAQIARLIGDGTALRAYQRDEAIFTPDAFAQALGFLIGGSALVYRMGGTGSRVLMSRLRPGDVFGMAALFHEPAAFPTEIRAEKRCKVLFLPKAWVQAAFAAEPQLSQNYIALLSERIHFLNRRLDALSGDDLPLRLLHTLEGLRPNAPPGTPFTLPFSMTQLAEMLGAGRASLYRAFDTLAAQGILSRDAKHITIHETEETS